MHSVSLALLAKHRDFRLYAAVRLFFSTAMYTQAVAVAWTVYDLTRRPESLGALGLAQFVPALLFLLFGGEIADRYKRHSVLVASYTASGLLSFALYMECGRAAPRLAVLYALLFCVGAARSLSVPAAQSLVQDVAPEGHGAASVRAVSVVVEMAKLLGPALGGYLLGPLGVHRVLGLVTVVVALCVVAVSNIRAGRVPLGLGRRGKDVFEGIRYVFSNRILLGAVSLDLFAVLLGGAVAMMPVYARDVLHIGPEGLGVFRAAPGFGAVLMGAWLAARPIQRNAGKWMFAAVAAFGLATIGFAYSRTLWLSTLMLVLLGVFDMVSVVTRSTLVQFGTPPELRGRVSAVSMLFIITSNDLGEVESGYLAGWLGVVPSVALGGIGALVVVALWAWWFPELRRFESLAAPQAT